MTFLPIVERELRVRARQKITHRFRIGSALVAMILVVFMLFLGSATPSPQSIGRQTFHTLAWLAFGYCLLEGVRTTADCLSEEKRAGTLGLLFLTDLKGYDVVLGKFVAASLNSFYALVAILPPLALPILIGGVTGAEFWRLVLMLTNTLFFSLCVGIFVSSISRDERKAAGATLAVLLAISALPFGLQYVPSPSFSSLGALSPAVGFVSLFDAAYGTNAARFNNSLWTIHLLSWCSLIGASLLLPHLWHEGVVAARQSRIELLLERLFPARARVKKSRKRWSLRLTANPVLWLASREQRSRTSLWLMIAFAGGAGIASWTVAYTARTGVRSIMTPLLALAVVGLTVHFTMAVCVAAQASGFFSDARSSGALELLLCTPLSVAQIVEGHRQALKRMFGPPVLAFAIVAAVIGLGHLYLAKDPGAMVVAPVFFLFFWIWLFLLLSDLYAVGEYGMWLGLVSRKPTPAFIKTLLYVVVLPIVLLFLLSAFCFFTIWPLLGPVKNLIFINYARDQLRRRFRMVATERFAISQEQTGSLLPLPRRRRHDLPSVLPR